MLAFGIAGYLLFQSSILESVILYVTCPVKIGSDSVKLCKAVAPKAAPERIVSRSDIASCLAFQ